VVWLYVLMCQGTVHVRVLDWCVCLQGHIGGIQCLQFDQRRLVTGGVDRAVRLWDVRSGRSVHKFYGHRVRRNRPGSICICTSFMDIGWGDTDQELPIFVSWFCVFLSIAWYKYCCCWFSLWATACGCCHSLCHLHAVCTFSTSLCNLTYISSALNMSVFLTNWFVD